jgi:hypothetical protein
MSLRIAIRKLTTASKCYAIAKLVTASKGFAIAIRELISASKGYAIAITKLMMDAGLKTGRRSSGVSTMFPVAYAIATLRHSSALSSFKDRGRESRNREHGGPGTTSLATDAGLTIPSPSFALSTTARAH